MVMTFLSHIFWLVPTIRLDIYGESRLISMEMMMTMNIIIVTIPGVIYGIFWLRRMMMMIIIIMGDIYNGESWLISMEMVRDWFLWRH